MSNLYDKNHLFQKAEKYCLANNSSLLNELGHGLQGIVYQTSKYTPISMNFRLRKFILIGVCELVGEPDTNILNANIRSRRRRQLK